MLSARRTIVRSVFLLTAALATTIHAQDNVGEESGGTAASFDTLQQQAASLAADGQSQDALERYEALQQLAPEDGRIAYNRGSLLMDLERWPDALDAFLAAESMGFGESRLYYNRGLTRFRLASYESAIADYSRAIDIAGEPDSETLINRAAAYERLGRTVDAIADLRSAADVDAASSAALVRLGALLIEADRPADARTAFDEALQRSPDDVEALFGRGTASYLAGMYREAYEDFSTYTDLRPDDEDGLVNLGLSALALAAGQPVRAGVASQDR